MFIKSVIRAIFISIIYFGFALTSIPAADFNLRATANSNENDEDYDGLVVFKNYVESASNGAISVELFIGTQLCSKGAECLQGVADGSIDIYISTSGGAAGIFPYVQVLDLPYLMGSDRVAEHVLAGDFTRKMRELALADSNGKIRLTIPKQKKNDTKSISSIKICYFTNWQKNHWNAISSSYNSSPFFTYYKDDFNILFQKKEKYLIDFNNKAQNIILKILQHNKTIKKTSKYEKSGDFIDLRNYKWEKDIIKNYEQVFIEKNGFLNNLSILDLIFNLGPESTSYLSKINIQPNKVKNNL